MFALWNVICYMLYVICYMLHVIWNRHLCSGNGGRGSNFGDGDNVAGGGNRGNGNPARPVSLSGLLGWAQSYIFDPSKLKLLSPIRRTLQTLFWKIYLEIKTLLFEARALLHSWKRYVNSRDSRAKQKQRNLQNVIFISVWADKYCQGL